MAMKNALSLLVDFDAAKAQSFAIEQGLRYYNVDFHRAAFALPTFVQTLLK